MSNYFPVLGDRVRVSFETVVDNEETAPWARKIALGPYHGVTIWVSDRLEAENISIEKLPDPEPVWRAGDVVRDARGWTFLRVEGYKSVWGDSFEWLRDAQVGYGVHLDAPSRPLTLVVRDGKPVSPS